MKILVLSDSHQYIEHMVDAIELEKPDYVIHLGDLVRDADELREQYPMLPIVGVAGNCDFCVDEQLTRMAEYDGVRVMMAHGHQYGVKSGYLRYLLAAREAQAEVALFGHTHCAYCGKEDGIWLVNPGACGLTVRPTYATVEIQNGVPTCTLHSL